jgi:hypothetical protein
MRQVLKGLVGHNVLQITSGFMATLKPLMPRTSRGGRFPGGPAGCCRDERSDPSAE